MTTTPMSPRPTQRQYDFIKRLLAEREVAPAVLETVAVYRDAAVKGHLSRRRASALIEMLLDQPVKAEAAPAPETMTFEQYAEANEWWDGELSDAEARADYARYVSKSEAAPNSCTPGQKCGPIDDLCTKHSAEYQGRWGRAANE